MQIAKFIVQDAGLLRVAAFLTTIAVLSGCADDRKAPLQTNDPAYSETIQILDHQTIAGNAVNGTFTLTDTITDGRLHLNAFLWPDAALNWYAGLGVELDSIAQRLLTLEGQYLNISLKPVKTHADSVAMDSLLTLKTASLAEEASRNAVRDSLDTRLDNRFKLSIWLDGDTIELYPRAIFLDSAAIPGQIPASETVVWGQNFFTAPPLDSTGVRGRRMTLDINRFFIADTSYRHDRKPARPGNPDGLPELYPITNWLTRLTPTTHTLHVRFGEAGARSEVSVNLYVVYKHAG